MDSENLFSKISKLEQGVFIIQDYMTIELAKLLIKHENKSNNLLFISDLYANLWIRDPIDLDILFNDCLQIAILDILKPAYSMLKFHPPYFVEKWKIYIDNLEPNHFAYNMVHEPITYASKLIGKNLIDEHRSKRHYNYVAEHIMLQPWADCF